MQTTTPDIHTPSMNGGSASARVEGTNKGKVDGQRRRIVAHACYTKRVSPLTSLRSTMSPYRIADAARISPYPSTIRAQEHEASTSSGSHSSPSKARLIAADAAAANPNNRSRGVDRSFSNTERQVQNEDARFNIGPKKFGNFMKLKRGVRSRAGRVVLDGIDEGVPDYPPPSFQEAISGSLAPSSTPTQSSSPASIEAPSHHSTDHQTYISENERSTTQNSLSETPSPSESEDSLEIIENTQPNELSTDRASRMGLNQGVKFPTPSLTSTPTAAANISIDSQSDSGPSRGRPSAKWSSKVDLTADDSEEEPQISPMRSTTKRFLSLSPLRTLFPAKHLAPQERAHSAHPVPESSPYSAPANANCYRSTTSLAASTVLRFPFGHSTLTLATPKPESVKSSSKKNLFRSKTREKEKEKEKEKKGKKKREFDEESDESWDSWEMLEGEFERGEIRRVEPEPRSLLAMIMPPADISSPVISSEDSSTRSLSFKNGGPPTPIPQSPKPSSLEPTEPPTSSWNEPHPLSLRDKKVAEAIEPFLKRRPKKAGSQRTKTTPNPIVVPSCPLGPQVTTVRSRLNPAYDSNDQHATDTNGHGSWEEWSDETVMIAESDISSVVGESTHDLHRALKTPLPSSPLQLILSPHSATNTPVRRSSSPPSTKASISSPTTPVPARSALFPDGRRGNYNQPSPDEAPDIPETFSTPSQTPRYTDCIPKAKITSLPSHHSSTLSTPSNPNSGNTLSPSPQSGRHHYVGRPLPRPPQAPRDTTVDSSYAGNISYASSSPDHSNASIPEGQPIDFENEADVDLCESWTPPEESAPMTPRRLSPVTSSTNTPDQSVRSMTTSGNASSISGLSGMTDLDLLAAALTDNSGRADYEDMLMRRDSGTSTWARLPQLMSQTCHSPVAWRLNEGGSHRMGMSN